MEEKDGNPANKTNKGNKLSRLVKASARLLSKIRDFYIMSLTECASHMDYGTALSGPVGQVPVYLPKSYSMGSTASRHGGSHDYKELVRAASTRSSSPNFRIKAARKSPIKVPRSQSVGIGRIEEEKTCEFEEDFTSVYSRSRSCGVHGRRRVN